MKGWASRILIFLEVSLCCWVSVSPSSELVAHTMCFLRVDALSFCTLFPLATWHWMRFFSKHSGFVCPARITPQMSHLPLTFVSKGWPGEDWDPSNKTDAFRVSRGPEDATHLFFFAGFKGLSLTQENQFQPIVGSGTVRPNKRPIHVSSCFFL
jgi:hypothetical protein